MRKLLITALLLLTHSVNAVVPSPIRLGVLLPLTGQYAAYGQDARRALEMSTCNGTTVVCFFEDDAFKAAQGLSAYQKLRQANQIDLLLVLDSPTLNALQPQIKKDKILTFLLTEALTHEADTIFQVMPASFPLYTALAEQADKRYSRVAVVYGMNEIFLEDAVFFRKGIPAEKIVYDEAIPEGSDYRLLALKVLGKKPDAVTFFTTSDDGIQFVRKLKDAWGDRPVKLICDANVGLTIDAYTKALGNELFEGCIATVLADRMSPEFKQSFKQKFNEEPKMLADYAYDAGEIINQLAAKPRDGWVDYVQKLQMNGVSGTLVFDDRGTRFPAPEVKEFRGGKFVAMQQ